MHDMQKLTVDVTFTYMTSKKGIKIYGGREVAAMYKEYMQLEDKKLMGEMDLDSLTTSKKESTTGNKPNKRKPNGKLKVRTFSEGRL